MEADTKTLKRKVASLAATLAQEKSETTGAKYEECIGPAIDKACRTLGITSKTFIKMYL
jgi:hypothetical protein